MDPQDAPKPRTTLDDYVLAGLGRLRAFVSQRRRGIAVYLFALLLLWVGQYLYPLYWIPSESMLATLRPGDVVVTRRLESSEPLRRNQVVVFYPSFAPQTAFVKRVVGLPGDTLQMSEGQLLRNGQLVEENFLHPRSRQPDETFVTMRWQAEYQLGPSWSQRPEPTRDNWGPLVIPSDRYFVLGDNREASADSRYWGLLERRQVRATLVKVVGHLPVQSAQASP